MQIGRRVVQVMLITIVPMLTLAGLAIGQDTPHTRARIPQGVTVEFGEVSPLAVAFGVDTARVRRDLVARISAVGVGAHPLCRGNGKDSPVITVSLVMPTPVAEPGGYGQFAGAALELRCRSPRPEAGVSDPIWTASRSGLMHLFGNVRAAADALPGLLRTEIDELVRSYGEGDLPASSGRSS